LLRKKPFSSIIFLCNKSIHSSNSSQQKENNSIQRKNLNPVAALLESSESSESSESFQPKEQFVSIGQARTEKTICVNYPEAGAEKSGTAAQQKSREAEKQQEKKKENA
jgi:hypothetical protein